MDVNWKELAASAQEGDQQAYRQLLESILPWIRRRVAGKLFDPDGVDDLCQEVLIAVHRSLHTWHPTKEFHPWLAAIIHYKYVDYIRKWGNVSAREVGGEAGAEILDRQSGRTPSPAAISEGPGDELLAALNSLPEKQRRSVELLKLEGLSVKEAAARTGMSESAVKVSAHRAYKALKKILKVRPYE